jgi:uncharacterized membrane protein
MFFIYGLIAFFFPIVYRKIRVYHVIFRLIVYALLLFSVEFISGFILDKLTGSCPWEYSSTFSICGYIRLDYVFFWMFFGFLVEKLFLYLDEMFLASAQLKSNSAV